MITNRFNRQFTTSRLGKHSRRTRQVSNDVKRKYLEEADSFTSDQITSTIKSCRSSRAYGPDYLSIFHLKNLGPLATEHPTALYNDSLKSWRLPSIWKSSRFPSPAKTHRKASPTDPSRCCAQVPRSSRRSSYPLSTNLSHQLKINTASDPDTLTTSAVLQLTTDIETGFNQRKPPHCTVDVAIDLTAAFDSVSWHTDIQDCRIVPAASHHSMAVLLPERGTSCNWLQRYQVENRPHRRHSRIQVVTFNVQLLHSWYAKADSPGQEGFLRWWHHSLGQRSHSWKPWSTVTREM